MYKYIDNAGNTRYLYSWRLVRTDTTPQGVKDEMPLRDKIKILQRDLDAGLILSGGNMTVLELVKKYVAHP